MQTTPVACWECPHCSTPFGIIHWYAWPENDVDQEDQREDGGVSEPGSGTSEFDPAVDAPTALSNARNRIHSMAQSEQVDNCCPRLERSAGANLISVNLFPDGKASEHPWCLGGFNSGKEWLRVYQLLAIHNWSKKSLQNRMWQKSIIGNFCGEQSTDQDLMSFLGPRFRIAGRNRLQRSAAVGQTLDEVELPVLEKTLPNISWLANISEHSTKLNQKIFEFTRDGSFNGGFKSFINTKEEGDWQYAYHGMPLYVLARQMDTGIPESKENIKGGVEGVYCYQERLQWKALEYSPWIPFDNTRTFARCMWKLCVNRNLKVGSVAKLGDQWCQPVKSVHIVSLIVEMCDAQSLSFGQQFHMVWDASMELRTLDASPLRRSNLEGDGARGPGPSQTPSLTGDDDIDMEPLVEVADIVFPPEWFDMTNVGRFIMRWLTNVELIAVCPYASDRLIKAKNQNDLKAMKDETFYSGLRGVFVDAFLTSQTKSAIPKRQLQSIRTRLYALQRMRVRGRSFRPTIQFHKGFEPENTGNSNGTRLIPIPRDYLEVAECVSSVVRKGENNELARWIRPQEGRKPLAVLCCGALHPGGGVLRGSSAQEENLFRRTTLAGRESSERIETSIMELQDITRTNWFWTADNVTVLLGREGDGYPQLDDPFKIDVVSFSMPKIKAEADYTPADRKNAARIVNMLVSYCTEHFDITVMCPIGCGAFGHPLDEVACLFKTAVSSFGKGGSILMSTVFPYEPSCPILESAQGLQSNTSYQLFKSLAFINDSDPEPETVVNDGVVPSSEDEEDDEGQISDMEEVEDPWDDSDPRDFYSTGVTWNSDGSVSNLVACFQVLDQEDASSIKESWCTDPPHITATGYVLTAKAIQFQGHSYRKWVEDLKQFTSSRITRAEYDELDARMKAKIQKGQYPCGKILPVESSSSSGDPQCYGCSWEDMKQRCESYMDYFSWSFMNLDHYHAREVESVRFFQAVYLWSKNIKGFDVKWWNSPSRVECRQTIAKAVTALFNKELFAFITPESKHARAPHVFYIPDYRMVEDVQKDRVNYQYVEYLRRKRPTSVTPEMAACARVFDLGFRLSIKAMNDIIQYAEKNDKCSAYEIWSSSKRSFARPMNVGVALPAEERAMTDLRRSMYLVLTPEMIRSAELTLFQELEKHDLVAWTCVEEDNINKMDRRFQDLSITPDKATTMMVDHDIYVEGQLVPIKDSVFGSLVSGLRKHLGNFFAGLNTRVPTTQPEPTPSASPSEGASSSSNHWNRTTYGSSSYGQGAYDPRWDYKNRCWKSQSQSYQRW